jgi:hypothetical protein
MLYQLPFYKLNTSKRRLHLEVFQFSSIFCIFSCASSILSFRPNFARYFSLSPLSLFVYLLAFNTYLGLLFVSK